MAPAPASKDGAQRYQEPVELPGEDPELTRDFFGSSMWKGDGRLSQLNLKLQLEEAKVEEKVWTATPPSRNPPQGVQDLHNQESTMSDEEEERHQIQDKGKGVDRSESRDVHHDQDMTSNEEEKPPKQEKGKTTDRQERRKSYANGETSQQNAQASSSHPPFYELSNRSGSSNRWGIYIDKQDRKSLQKISRGVEQQKERDQRQQTHGSTSSAKEMKRAYSFDGQVFELEGSSPIQHSTLSRNDRPLPPTPPEQQVIEQHVPLSQSQSQPQEYRQYYHQGQLQQQQQQETRPRDRSRTATMTTMPYSWIPSDDIQYKPNRNSTATFRSYRSNHQTAGAATAHRSQGEKIQQIQQQEIQQQQQQEQQQEEQLQDPKSPQYPSPLGAGPQPTDQVDWDGPDDPEHPYNWPAWKKVLNCGLISFMTLISPLGSSIFAPAIPLLHHTFPTATPTSTIASFVVSVFVLGFALGPLIFAPLSEIHGRVVIYHVSNLGFVASCAGCALSPTMPSLVGLRFLSGFFASVAVSNGAGSIADMIAQEKRGFAMAVFGIGPLLGPIVGPVVGGFLADAKGWRWVFWVLGMLVAGIGGLMLFCLSETYEPVLLERRARRRRQETGDPDLRSRLDEGLSSWEHLKRGSVRPLKLLFRSPIALILALVTAVTYGYLFILFTTMAEVFKDFYGFDTRIVGLSYLGLGLGCVIGVVIFSAVSDRYIKKATAAEINAEGTATTVLSSPGTASDTVPSDGGEDGIAMAAAAPPPQKSGPGMKPEHRFFMMPAATMVMPLGFFLYGWTVQYRTHWIVPMVGTTIIGAANLIIFMCVNMYLVDGFTLYAASAVASNTVVRSIAGSVLPIAGLKLYRKLGIGWGNSLLGFVSIGLIPVAFLLVRYGEYLRLRKEIKNL